jgi:hypothetical protein
MLALLLTLAAMAAPNWAMPTPTAISALGLETPLRSDAAESWQAADGAGGWVRLYRHPSAEAADQAYTFLLRAATTRPQPALQLPGADEAAGDGQGYVLLRSRNIIIELRSADEGAGARARGLLGALKEG